MYQRVEIFRLVFLISSVLTIYCAATQKPDAASSFALLAGTPQPLWLISANAAISKNQGIGRRRLCLSGVCLSLVLMLIANFDWPLGVDVELREFVGKLGVGFFFVFFTAIVIDLAFAMKRHSNGRFRIAPLLILLLYWPVTAQKIKRDIDTFCLVQ